MDAEAVWAAGVAGVAGSSPAEAVPSPAGVAGSSPAVAGPSPAEAGSSLAEVDPNPVGVDPNPVEAADPNLAVPAEGPRTVEAVPTGDPNRHHPEVADSNSAEAADSNHRPAGIGLRLLHPYR